jgi:predicted MFS family arabinose efflux permease
LQWVLSAYALASGGLLLLGRRAADLLGRPRVFMAGAVFFTAASLLCGLAWSPAALLAARVVQGRRSDHDPDRAVDHLHDLYRGLRAEQGVAIVTTVAVSRSQHYLAAHKGANPLAALTEGYQSAFLACAALAAIGLALAFLLPGRPRKPAHELPEPDPAADAAAAGDVVIRSGTK